MPSTSNPFGLRPAKHASGLVRRENGTIASGYATAIFKHSPVKMLSDGTIGAAAAGDSIIGTFLGCEYIDSVGRVIKDNQWVAATAGTNIVAYFTRDQGALYEIQADATLAQTAVGTNVDISSVGGNAVTGLATCMAAASTSATTSSTLQIVDFRPGPDNAPGDTYPILIVRIFEHQLAAIPTAGV
jgi:hypothetical protein